MSANQYDTWEGQGQRGEAAQREVVSAPMPLFTRPGSSFAAGVSLPVAEFLAADPADLTERLRQFVERISWRPPNDAEVASWATSIPAMQRLLDDPRLHGLVVLLEAVLPRGLGRVDCVLLGSDPQGSSSIIVLELKAWSDAKKARAPSDMLMPLPPGRKGPEVKAHPSLQALGYRTHLKDLLVACHDETSVTVSAAAWLYNALSCARAPFNDASFGEIQRSAPAYGASQIADLRSHLLSLAPSKPNSTFLQRLDTSEIRPSRSLMERFTSRLADFAGFDLTDDQIEAYHRIVNAYDANERRVIIVKGGPGTGKTVLGLHLLQEFYKRNMGALYFACSQAIINSYKTAFQESRSVFANTATLGRSNVPVQIIDEAHRLRDRKQIKKAIESAMLSVFLIDDRQIILPGDIPGSRAITETAASLCPRKAVILDLTGEKRCGSEVYLRWIDAALGIHPISRPRVASSYRFEIVDSPHDLECKLRESGSDWRITAGVCWPRSSPTASGELVDDVAIPEFGFHRPWSGDHKKLLDSRLYRAALCWATEPEAQRYIGNVYTAQSFEFDYVGVIFGNDLVVRERRWIADLDRHPKTDVRFYSDGAACKRPARSRDCLQNIYRVLLTRGRKGCFVFFQDAETRSHFAQMLADGELGP